MGSAEANLIVLGGPDGGRRIRLDRLPVTLGRSAESGIRLSEQYVSREHAELSVSPDGIVLEVRSSRGLQIDRKTYKRGKRILLGTGDILKLGTETEILFVDVGADTESALADVQAARQASYQAKRAAAEPRSAAPEPAAAEVTSVEQPAPAAPAAAEQRPAPAGPPNRGKRMRKIIIGVGAYLVGIAVLFIVLLAIRSDQQDASPPQVLKKDQLTELLTEPLKHHPQPAPNSQQAAEALDLARRKYMSRNIHPGDGYWCVYHYERHKALSGLVTFRDDADQSKWDAASEQLVEKVKPLYESACQAAHQERWSKAMEYFEKIVGNEGGRRKRKIAGLVPDQHNRLHQNVRKHLEFIQERRRASKRAARRFE